MTQRRMQVERAMRLAAMQVERDADDGDVREPKRDNRIAPPWEIEQAGKEHLRLSVHRPAKRRARAARLAADFPGGAAGLALVPQAAGRDLVGAVAAPAVECALAPMIQMPALVRQRRADVADTRGLGELVGLHATKITRGGCRLRAPRRLALCALADRRGERLRPKLEAGNQPEKSNMNWDRIEGNWKQFKGNVLQQWGKLTDDQLEVIAGRRDLLLGRIQELYGISKDETETQLADWEKRMQEVSKPNDTTLVPPKA